MRFRTREAQELRNPSKPLPSPLFSRRAAENAESNDSAPHQTPLASAVQRAKADPNQLSSQDVLLLQSSLGNRKTAALIGRTPLSQSPGQAATGAGATGTAMGGLDPDADPPGQEQDMNLGGIATLESSSATVNRDDTDTATATAPAPAPTTTATTISSTTNSGPTWNANGAFDWRVGFGTTGRTGWIVQEIINTFTGKTATGGDIASGITPHYWEAWAVDGSGTITPAVGPNNDYWIRSNRGASTKGEWSMTGKVFFTTTDPATQGFTAGGVKNAGILLSTTSQPSGLGSVLLNRQANGKWDSIASPAVAHAGSAA